MCENTGKKQIEEVVWGNMVIEKDMTCPFETSVSGSRQ
jgi:hypothetical protein